jgi:hypothetical protein
MNFVFFFLIKVKSVFGAKMFALGVVVKVPVPKQTAKTSFQTTSGKAKYNASIDSLVWKYVLHCLLYIVHWELLCPFKNFFHSHCNCK